MAIQMKEKSYNLVIGVIMSRRRCGSSLYGEKSNPGTIAIASIGGLIVLLAMIAMPVFLLSVIIMIPVFILVNEACKRRRKNPDTGKWEWCPPQKGVNMWKG